MSLINDMLRDLEARRQRDGRGTEGGFSLAVRKQPGQRNRFFFAFLTFIVLGTVVAWLVMQSASGPISRPQPAQSNTTVGQAAPPHENTPVEQPQSTTAAAAVIRPLLPIAAMTPPVAAGEDRARLMAITVEDDKRQARISVDFDHLPEYRLLSNGEMEGQLVVAFRATGLESDFAVPEFNRELLRRISLMPRRDNLDLLVDLNAPAQVRGLQLLERKEGGYRLVIEVFAVPEQVVRAKDRTSEPAAEKRAPAATAIRPEASDALKVSKRSQLISPERVAYQQGMAQLRQGNPTAARQSLSRAVAINPQLFEARLQLIDLLLRQNESAAAEAQLGAGLDVMPGNFLLRKRYARLLLTQGRLTEAVDLLRSPPLPAPAKDQEYYALLAALLQETGRYDEAGDVYGRLLQVRSDQSVWWFGLALSMDQLGRVERAREAYGKALELPGLSPDLQDYIHARLQAL